MRSLRFPLAFLLCFAAGCSQLAPLSTEQALDRLNVSTTRVYDAQGNVIANLHGEIDRHIIPLAQVPPPVRDAVIAIEDERFYSHQGIDVRSIARAARQNAATVRPLGVQGGSTISQQLAKNLYFPRPSRTVARKVAEARVTVQLERTYSKDRILEMYLNTIYLGRGVYGIEAAARSYFGKTASQLDLSDAAFLAGLIHEPGRYEWNPSDSQTRQAERRRSAQLRRNTVLERMVALGFTAPSEAEAAKRAPLRVRPAGEERWRHPYFVDLVLRQLGVLRSRATEMLDPRFDFLGRTHNERAERAYRGGLRIYTTLDPRAQAAAEQAVAAQLPADLPRLSAALTAIEPATGYVRALVGGRNYYPDCRKYKQDELPHVCRLARVNLALGDDGGGSGRQPGSSFKPFVLVAALLRGIPLTQAYDSSEFTHKYEATAWEVNNYEGGGGGARDLVDATAKSVNAVYARLEIEGVGDGNAITGAGRVATVARRMGIDFPTVDQIRDRCGSDYLKRDSCVPADVTPAIALGAKEVSPYEMAAAYATLANDGVRVAPTAIVRVTDLTGNVLYQADPERKRVIPAGVARAATSVMTTVVDRGTGVAADIGRPAAGKTGTSESWRDAWFDGFVPQLTAAVWVGNPIPVEGRFIESMTPANGYPYRIVGGTIPARIWHDFMSKALEGIRVRDFEKPPNAFFNPQAANLPDDTPAPTATVAAVARIVPDVTGRRVGRASSELTAAGFGVVTVSRCDPSGDAAPGDVWRQSPPAGSQTSGQVTLWFSSDGCD